MWSFITELIFLICCNYCFSLISKWQHSLSELSWTIYYYYYYYYYYYITPYLLFTPVLLDGLSLESEWQHVLLGFQDLFSILVDLDNAVVWKVLSHPPFSNYFSSFSKPLEAIQSEPITIGITVTFMSFILLSLFTPWEFFTSVLADGFSQEFEWQQVSSSLQDSSQYSGHSQ